MRDPSSFQQPIGRRVAALLIVLVVSPFAMAEESADEPPIIFERVRVVGDPEDSSKNPGSVTYVGKAELAKQSHTDVQQVLSLVPGVNIQEEEGYGLRPNIGMRGSGSERSEKITLMEDGVLIAPAPYAASSAYYFPTMGRMEGLEVRKGSSSIRQGPYSNGGVLNMISKSIPSGFGGTLDLAYGNDATGRGRLNVGDMHERFGWVAETFQMRTDGFKQLDGGGDTGFELEDYLFKFRFNSAPTAAMFQALELKLGKTEQFGNETYLGLAQSDFDRTPIRRYAGSQQDTIDTDHDQYQLRYLVKPSDKLDLTATAYRNGFYRNWHKLQSVAGVDIAPALEQRGLLAILRGEVDSDPGALKLRNNRREYFSQGVQVALGIKPGGSGSTHDIEVGLRYHQDQEDRFQEEDGFQMLDGVMVETGLGDPGSQANRIRDAEALAFYVQDVITLSRWTIIPGVRVELIDFEQRDYGQHDPARTGDDLVSKVSDVQVAIPGVSASYKLNSHSNVFGSVHRGFAPPGPGARDETLPEESINYEFGYRGNHAGLGVDVVGFFNDYDNLLGSDTISSGGTGEGDMFNGGAVETYGLETGLTYDFDRSSGGATGIPLNFTYTYTSAEFKSTFESEFAGWGDHVMYGDELPYVPQHQAALGIGVERLRWSAYANFTYKDQMRTVAGQGPIVEAESTDEHLLLDLTANYKPRRDLRIFVSVRNLTDEIYVAARRPAGARPGLPRTAMAGLVWDF